MALVYFLIGQGFLFPQECRYIQQENLMNPRIQIVHDLVKNHRFEYQLEELGEDYWKAPYETERDGGGDCEDLSIWLLYELRRMNYDVWAVIGEEGAWSHMWLRVRIHINGKPYVFDVDMTEGFMLPAYEIIPTPMMAFIKFQELDERQKAYEQGE